MVHALLSLVVAVFGMAAVLGIWFLIQAAVRLRSGCRPDRDVLDYLLHGCGGCDNIRCAHRKPE
jgi:hypothetical protein